MSPPSVLSFLSSPCPDLETLWASVNDGGYGRIKLLTNLVIPPKKAIKTLFVFGDQSEEMLFRRWNLAQHVFNNHL